MSALRAAGPDTDGYVASTYGDLLGLGGLAVRLAGVERALRYPDGRRENDAEHSFHLALSAPELAHRFYPDLDLGLVAQFSLVHDLPEAYAGDTWTFRATEEDLRKKRVAEQAAMERLLKELPPYTCQLLERYERQVEPEARFVRFVDKVMPAVVQMVAFEADTFLSDQDIGAKEELDALMAGNLEKFQAMFPEITEVQLLIEHAWRLLSARLYPNG